MVVAIGIVLYVISEKIALKVYDTDLSTYGGASDISIINTIKNLNVTVIKAYKEFAKFFIRDDIIVNNNMSRDRN